MTSEGQLFKSQVGENWKNLSPNIQKRFDTDPPHNKPLKYDGIMTRVECSVLGKIFANLIRFSGALLPYSGTNVPVDIEVYTKPDRLDIFKNRVYFFPSKKPFTFKSNMCLDKNGDVLEFVGFGLGMKIIVFEKEGNLHFKDNGYFWQIGRLRIPLPRLLTPGNTYLIHSDMGEKQFGILIDITHPLFGRMYYQEGIFNHKES